MEVLISNVLPFDQCFAVEAPRSFFYCATGTQTATKMPEHGGSLQTGPQTDFVVRGFSLP